MYPYTPLEACSYKALKSIPDLCPVRRIWGNASSGALEVWVAVEELQLGYHYGEIISFTMCLYCGMLHTVPTIRMLLLGNHSSHFVCFFYSI